MKHKLHFTLSCSVTTVVDGVTYAFRVVASYEHMGAITGDRPGMKREACKRVASMNEHFVPVRSKLYSKQSICVDTRTMLARSLCLSRLLYNAGA